MSCILALKYNLVFDLKKLENINVFLFLFYFFFLLFFLKITPEHNL